MLRPEPSYHTHMCLCVQCLTAVNKQHTNANNHQQDHQRITWTLLLSTRAPGVIKHEEGEYVRADLAIPSGFRFGNGVSFGAKGL